MHRRRLDQTAFGFAFVKTCVAHVPDIVIEYMRIPQLHHRMSILRLCIVLVLTLVAEHL